MKKKNPRKKCADLEGVDTLDTGNIKIDFFLPC